MRLFYVFLQKSGVLVIKKMYAESGLTPTFVVIDRNMPLMIGLQCLQEIKKTIRLEKVPVYICSTAADPNYIDEVKKWAPWILF